MFGLSFLTILNIYKDYFKGRKRAHKCETKFQVQVLKPCKSVQEISEEVLDFKAR